MKPKGLIVFDMDGVIVDVSGSYRETVRQTARLFFQEARSWQDLPDPLFPLTDLATVKQSGGLNNDWDLTFWIVNLLFTLVEGLTEHNDPDPWSRHTKTIRRCDVAALARFLNSTQRPLTTLLEKNGKQKHKFITGLYTGDVGSGNIIKQIFQEIYLGKDLFESTYNIPAKVYYGEGYINRERLLIDTPILKSLAKRNILAIATGRPRAEADYPLDFFGLRKYFASVITLDDCLEEEHRIFKQKNINVSLGKPNPYMLDVVAETFKSQVSEFYYIGDMPDDMVAASRSMVKFVGIGILISSSEKDALRQDLLRAGADYIIKDFMDLKVIIESQNR